MSLRERLEQLEERERRLLMVFFGVLGGMFLIILPLALAMSVGAQESENERVRDIIQQIADERVTLGQRQADSQQVERRYARKAPPLASYLAQTADKVGVEIPETQDRSTVPHGKNFKERVTKIRLRKVGMLKLATFMDRIVNSGYALSISRLNIRKRGTKPDEFDAEMEISAFDREESKKKSKTDEDSGDEDSDEEEE